jgi:hypothetical protein
VPFGREAIRAVPDGPPDDPRLYLGLYALAWAVVAAPATYLALGLSTRECDWRPAYGWGAAALALAELACGGWLAVASPRWWVRWAAWGAILLPPVLAVAIGFGCNVGWW